jgi:signal transduction histidine kinase
LGLTTVAGVPLSSVVENPIAEMESVFHGWAGTRSPVPGRLVWKTVKGPQSPQLEAWCAEPASAGKPGLVIVHCKPFFNIADRFLLLNDRLEMLRKEVLARKQVAEELVSAVKARDEFIAVAAHELRNPLNVFHLSLQLLYRRFGQIEGIRDILNRSQFQLNRLNMLVERLLDVSRIRSGKYELHLEPFDLTDLIREVVARFTQQYPKAPIELQAERSVTATWDRGRIDQAITNLLSNAIKYGQNNPIKVTVAVVDDEAVVSVTDQGIGLAASDVTRIFEQFERAAPAAISEGFGLGLWITRQIAQAHRGSVTAAGEPGLGSTFTLRLPIDGPRS